MKNFYVGVLGFIAFGMFSAALAQTISQWGIRDYSPPPVSVANGCGAGATTCILEAGSSSSAGVIGTTSTTGTTAAITWNKGQFPQALTCVVSPGNAAAYSGAIKSAVVTYSSNVPTLTVTVANTEASMLLNYLCVGQ